MLLTPRYGTNPVITLDGDPGAIGSTAVRQRRRLVETLTALTDEQWTRPSRCSEWSVKDVVAHLSTTNLFWEASIRSGTAGTPTAMLTSFDPVASPAQMVSESAQSAAEIVEAFASSTESLAACLSSLSPTDWVALAESPPGHVSVSTVVHHALWDSWIHERDILLPLGVVPDEEPDEVIACLRYVAGFTPALALNGGAVESGSFDVSATEPDVSFHVAIDTEVAVTDGSGSSDFTLTGSAVDVVEALSFRVPMTQVIPPSLDWAFSGLGTVFDR